MRKPYEMHPNRYYTGVLVGGGLDSHAFMVLNHLNVKMHFIHVDYGQRVAEAEANAVEDLAMALGIHPNRMHFVKCDEGNHMRQVNEGGLLFGTGPVEFENAFVRGRNLFMIQKAIELGFGRVHLTLTKERGTMFPDADYAFVELVDNLMRRSYDVRVDADYISKDKWEVMKQAYYRFPNFFDMSFTCWVDPEKECGKCPHCEKKATIRTWLEDPQTWKKFQTDEEWQRIKTGYGNACGIIPAKATASINAGAAVVIEGVQENGQFYVRETKTLDDLIESRAEQVYNAWANIPEFKDEFKPWVPRGNSLKQDEARKIARAEFKTDGPFLKVEVNGAVHTVSKDNRVQELGEILLNQWRKAHEAIPTVEVPTMDPCHIIAFAYWNRCTKVSHHVVYKLTTSFPLTVEDKAPVDLDDDPYFVQQAEPHNPKG